MAKTLIIGVGNAFRGDDGLGLAVAQRLRALDLGIERLKIFEQNGEATTLVETWGNADRVIVVDAMSSGAEPGTVHRFEVTDHPLPARFSGGSTHTLGLVEAIELARQLDRLPEHLIVYGVEGKNFELGAGLSSEVQTAAERLVKQIPQELG